MQIENKQKKNEAFLFILPDFTYNLDVKHCISLLPSLKLERANSGSQLLPFRHHFQQHSTLYDFILILLNVQMK